VLESGNKWKFHFHLYPLRTHTSGTKWQKLETHYFSKMTQAAVEPERTRKTFSKQIGNRMYNASY
jgi:hypothetical protein